VLRPFFHRYNFPTLKSKTGLFFILIVTAIISCPVEAMEPASGPWSLEADRIISEGDPQQIIAEGEVVLEHQKEGSDLPLQIRADTVTYRADNSNIDARGHVLLREKNGLISADSIILDFRTNKAQLNSASISLADHQLYFSSHLVEKTGESSYLFRGGRATSCRVSEGRSPDWAIGWGEANITVDGMAYLKHATFRIRDIPVLYIPYLILPAKISRQTGFLFPELSHSNRDGTGAIIPFFVNLSPSSDLTYYPGYYSRRGTFSGLEFRYVAANDSRLTLAANYLHDRSEDIGLPGSLDDYRQDGILRTEHDRYWVRGKADHHFSEDTVMRLDIDTVSDQDFLLEFPDGITGFSASNHQLLSDFNRGLQEASLSFRESILQFSGHDHKTSGGLEMRYVDDPLADLTSIEPTHTLPRVVLNSRLPIGELPIDFGWGSEYVYYRPEDGIGYQRLNLAPRLIMPMPLWRSFEGSLSGGIQETIYRVETIGSPLLGWNSSANKNRNSWDLSANIATVLARDFTINDQRKLTHTFRPNLAFRSLENSDQTDLPDLDSFDRLTEGKTISLEFNNYFSSRGPALISARQLGYFKLSQSYDLDEGNRDLTGPDDRRRPFSDLVADLEIRPGDDLLIRYLTTINHYGNGITAYELRAHYRHSHRNYLDINYTYEQGVSTDLTVSSKLQLTGKLALAYSTARSLLDDHKRSEALSLLYSPQCWGMELTASEDAEDQRLMLTFSLTGLGKASETN
jgi:LPS-assembly protein